MSAEQEKTRYEQHTLSLFILQLFFPADCALLLAWRVSACTAVKENRCNVEKTCTSGGG